MRMRDGWRRGDSGQAALLLLAVLVVLLAALLWNADLHALATRKTKAQNAGDAAALAAARWQANTLNLVGQLNLAHLEALEAGDLATATAITSMQARISFAGPLTGLAAAQAAARRNGIPSDDDYTALLARHAEDVLEYARPVGGGMALPEPYPGAWVEYHDALMDIARAGVAAAPDNAKFFFDPDGDHILLSKDFYEAVAGRQWCWFFLNCSTGGDRTILDDFTDHTWFDPLPPPGPPLLRNPEIFGVGIETHETALRSNPFLARYLEAHYNATTNSLAATATWYFHSPAIWSTHWDGMSPDDEDPLPLAGPVRDEYDYAGADAVVRLHANATLLSPSASGEAREILWTAAAKPFGYIGDAASPVSGGEKLRPNAFGLVLPAYRAVRLIPIDAATSGADGSFDIDWRRHCVEHLPPYLGTGALAGGCRYCDRIRRFEDAAFRRQGSDWLRENSYKCTLPSHGGGHGGGTRRGH